MNGSKLPARNIFTSPRTVGHAAVLFHELDSDTVGERGKVGPR